MKGSGQSTGERGPAGRGISRAAWVRFGDVSTWAVLVAALVSVTCFGPDPVPLLNSRMTVERHNEEEFPTAHGESENPTGDCNVCHGGLDSFSEFNCLGCHTHNKEDTDTFHSSVDDYIYDSVACYGCHPTGEAMSRDAHDAFPISEGTAHEDAACDTCHSGGSYSSYSCLGCHEHAEDIMDSTHTGVDGYVYDSASCLACHPTGEAIDRSEHDDFPIDEGTVHEDAACTQCHTSGSYDAFSCLDCHEHGKSLMDTEHAQVKGYVYDSDSCLACHPDAYVITLQQHNAYFPITSGTHSQYTCMDCHQEEGDFATFTCIGCHTGAHTCNKMDSVHQEEGIRNYECEDEKCYSCHPDGHE